MRFLITILLLIIGKMGCSQPPADRPKVLNPDFDAKISSTIRFTVPTIGAAELNDIRDEVYIFDAREKEEFDVSHIKGATYLGYKDFDEEVLAETPKEAKIVLYCSIGYRSEKIGERLQKLGYQQVYNLYGSIFEWVNQGYPVIGPDGNTTDEVHTYNSNWSKWVDENKAKKVW